MKKFLSAFTKDEQGITAIEYALIAAFVAVVIIGGLSVLGTNLSNMFNKIATTI